MNYLILNQKQHKSYSYQSYLNEKDSIFFIELIDLNIKHDFSSYPCPAYLIKINFFEYNCIQECIDALLKVHDIENFKIVCVQEKYLDIVGQLRDYYKIEGIDNSTILKFRNKLLMKNIASNGGLLVPLNFSFDKKLKYNDVVDKVGRKFVLKPIYGMGSLTTFVIEDAQEYNQILSKYNLENFEFEQFLDGEAGCIDAIVFNREIKYQQPLLYSIDTLNGIKQGVFSTLPLNACHPHFAKIIKFNEMLVEAFDVDYGVLHSEFFIVKDEVYFLESCIRPPGGLNVIVHSVMNSVDFLKIATCFEMNPEYFELKFKPILKYCLPIIFFSNEEIVPELRVPNFKAFTEVVFNKVKAGEKWIPSLKSGLSYASLLLTSENYDEILHDFVELRKKYKR